MRTVAFCLAPLLLAGCGDSEPVEETEPAIVPPDAVPPDVRRSDAAADEAPDAAGPLGSDRVAQGRWFASSLAGVPAALFGPPESEASLSVRCERGELVFARAVQFPEGPASMRLMAAGESRTLRGESSPEPLPQVTARLDADSAFAATLGETVEPIAVAVEDGPTLRMPAAAALREVVNDCRA